jgi:ubiquinone biosynthesis protein COQ4
MESISALRDPTVGMTAAATIAPAPRVAAITPPSKVAAVAPPPKVAAIALPPKVAAIAPPPKMKIEWRRAWRAVRTLMDDPDRTEQAFEVIAALSGRDFERLFQRFLTHPDGRALLAERPSLLETLSDREALRALPEGSFGRAYADFMEAGHLTAQGLVEAEAASEAAVRIKSIDAERAWFGNRLRDIHDLWHVLTGYGRDEAGEAANLAFTFAQMPQRGIALILLFILTRPHGSRVQWPRYLYRAWKRGRRAAWLPAVVYERLLPLPLETVRSLLAIPPAHEVHPEGIMVASRAG